MLKHRGIRQRIQEEVGSWVVLAGGRSLEEETSPSSHSLLVDEVEETSFGDDIPVESTLGSLMFCCLLREG